MSGTAETATRPDAGEGRLRYQPALDGLRAVAVLAVIAYHDAYAWAAGGFLGVDTFFVLSGFLITTLLVLEETRSRTVDLLAFWGRRVRRLLPALLLVLVAVAIYGWTSVSSLELNKLRGDSLASLFYVANWRFIFTGASYFDIFSSPSPVRHLWSLAIEEQFYLVWPLVVLGVYALFRHGRRALLVVALVGIAASTAIMALLYDSQDPSRAYFGTDARIHTILVGAVLAIVLVSRPPRSAPVRHALQAAGLVGAVAVAWAMHSVSDVSSAYYHGGSLLFAIAVAAVIAAVVQPGPAMLRRGLSLTPFVWIGRISYGLYLWHWPVNVYLTEARVGVGGTRLNIVRLAVTFAFATASYFLVEMPIRRGKLRARPARWLGPVAVAGTGVALLAATAGATSLPSYLGGGATHISAGALARSTPASTLPDTGTGDAPGSAGVDFRTGGAVAAPGTGILNCPPPSDEERQRAHAAAERLGAEPASRPGGPLRVLVVGDSLGCSIAVGLGAAGSPAISVDQATIIGCGVVSDQVFDESEPFPRGTENCDRLAPGLEERALTRFEPDVVLWVSTWERMNYVVGNHLLRTGTVEWKQELERRLAAGVDRLTRNGARVVFVTVASPSPASMIHDGRIVSPAFDWKFPTMDAELAGFAATHPTTTSVIDVAKKICPHGAPCPLYVEAHQPRHGDGAHFAPEGSVWIDRWMLPQILAAAPTTPVVK